MPKYTLEKIEGYWLYYTATCLKEGIIHVHANEPEVTRQGSAKIWVHEDGSSTVQDYGKVTAKDMLKIQKWIQTNIDLIHDEWVSNGEGGEFKQK